MRILKSSEISSYLFCPISWWLERTKGVKITKAMVKGEKHHKTISKNQPRAKLIYVLMAIVLAIIILMLLFRFLR
tara:strand:+ start:67 stop:291 length:225 start_codon:yes stop_codon:yes gene_type:complete